MIVFRRNAILLFTFLFFASCATPPTLNLYGTKANVSAAFECDLFPLDNKSENGKREVASGEMCRYLFAPTPTETTSELSTAEANKLLQETWQSERTRDKFDLRDSNAFWGTLIGKEKLEQALLRDQHPADIFGERTSQNWRLSYRLLDEIPVGELKLTPDLVSRVNDIIVGDTKMQAVYDMARSSAERNPGFRGTFAKVVRDSIQAADRWFPLIGGRYRVKRLLHNYTRTPMSEAEFELINQDPANTGVKFLQLPYGREGKRYGVVVYPKVADMRPKIAELLTKTNREIQAIREGRSKKDPIALAAEFQWMFVALHPMTNGNGRTSRALMNRILAEFGLPPSLRSKIDLDYGLPLDQHVELVREGVIEYIRRFATESSITASIHGRGFGTRMNSAALAKLAGEVIPPEVFVGPKNFRKTEPGREKFDNLPERPDQVMRIDKSEFTFGDDTFFHDQYRIPHVAVQVGDGVWKLYPVSVRTYSLYGFGGPRTEERSVKRDLNAAATEQVKENLKFFLARSRGQVKKVEVEPFERIEKAANEDTILIYPFQFQLALDSLTIKEDPLKEPMDVLVQNRGDNTEDPRVGRTSFEQAYFENSKEVTTGQVIEQYMVSYLNMEKARRSFNESNPDLTLEQKQILNKTIDASQAKLHTAARQMLAPFLMKVAELRSHPEAQAYLSQHPEFNLIWQYVKLTPLFYDSIQAAFAAGHKDKVAVVRSAASGYVKYLGFTSDAQVRRLIYAIPKLGNVVNQMVRDLQIYIREYSNKGQIILDPTKNYGWSEKLAMKYAPLFADSKAAKAMITGLVQYVLVHPYAYRSMDPQANTEFVTDFLHAQLDLGPKERLSTTVNPAYVLRLKEDKGVYDAKFAMSNPEIFMMEVPISEASVDNASRFVSQAEVRINPVGPLKARGIIKYRMKANQDNVFPIPENPPPKAVDVLNSMRSVATGLKAPSRGKPSVQSDAI